MKLVINKCFGGFGVSIAAMKEMIGKCPHVIANDPIKWYGSKEKWEAAIADPNNIHRDYMYFDDRNWVVTDDHRSDARDCPVLVATVERMGAAASSSLAKLRVVEIPDGIEYDVDEYDGIEHVAEKHQTWG
jgi:hypothetical protein